MMMSSLAAAALGLVVSPSSFGAAGDGSRDDSTALQAALDHVAGRGGGTVRADGRFRLDRPIFVLKATRGLSVLWRVWVRSG